VFIIGFLSVCWINSGVNLYMMILTWFGSLKEKKELLMMLHMPISVIRLKSIEEKYHVYIFIISKISLTTFSYIRYVAIFDTLFLCTPCISSLSIYADIPFCYYTSVSCPYRVYISVPIYKSVCL